MNNNDNNTNTNNAYIYDINSYPTDHPDNNENNKDDNIPNSKVNKIQAQPQPQAKEPEQDKDKDQLIQDTIIHNEEVGIFESTIAVILNDLKPSEDLKQSFSILEDDYLEVKSIIPVTKSEFDLIQKQFSNESFMKTKKEIDNLPLTGSSIDNKLLSIIDLINFICREPNKRQSFLTKVPQYEKILVKWRRVKGDGNCFYRSVIFQYFESIIVNRKDQMLRNVIVDIVKNYNEPLFKSRLGKVQISIERILLVLMLINFALLIKDVNESISKAMSILIKAFNNYKDFDYCMVMYLRFEIYKFIRDNEGKLYSKTFSVNIGNLLQSMYETNEGKFLYEKFYEGNLLEMGKDAEKIIIYITPYVLQMNIKIFAYDFGKKENELNEFSFVCPGDKERSKEKDITLMYLGNHFDIIYESEYYYRSGMYLTGEKVNVQMTQMHKQQQQHQNQQPNVISLKTDEIQMTGTTGGSGSGNAIKGTSQVQLRNNQLKNSTTTSYQRTQTEPSQSQSQPQVQPQQSQPVKPQPILIAQCLKPNECPICHIKVNRNFICDSCHSNQLKTWLKQRYSSFISYNQTNLINQKPVYSYKQYLNELPITYDNGAVVSFDKAYASLPQQSQFNLSSLLQELKSSICLCCHQLIQDTEDSIVFEMPCGCSLCKTDCLRNFFKVIPLENRVQPNYYCICGIEYDITQLKYLVNFFKSHGLKRYKNSVIRFVYAKMKNKCANCRKDINMKGSNVNVNVNLNRNFNTNANTNANANANANANVNVIEVKDEEIEKIFNVSRFHHLICDNCAPGVLNEAYNTTGSGFNTNSNSNANSNKQYHSFKCSLCNTNHQVIKRFSTKAEIINETSCTIF